ncbi:MAG: type I DNA topoisomerase [Planctomycetaceae bacterium]
MAANRIKGLVIVESPAKAKKIGGYLGKDYEVRASVGHVRDLPEDASQIPEEIKGEPWSRLGVNVNDRFTPVYVVPPDKRKVITELKSLLKGADELIIATDEDREGESIGWHLAELLAPKVPIRRMVFSEITKKAINEALSNTRDIDMDLVQAQETRRILDRLYGYTLSPLLWKKIRPKLSAGRVQSVAVRVLVQRELERAAFTVSEYWDVEATLSDRQGAAAVEAANAFKVTLNRVRERAGNDWRSIASGKDFDEITGQLKADSKSVHIDEPGAVKIALDSSASGAKWVVHSVERKPGRRKAPPPFTTSTLQQTANARLNMTARQAMSTAQRLYENGHITYMRTDSTNLSQEALNAARDAILRKFGKDKESGKDFYAGPRQFTSKTKNAQEAHEAIRPAGEEWQTSKQLGLSGAEASLYDLVWQRAVASQMADHEYLTTTYTIHVGDYEYTTSGTIDTFLGYEQVYRAMGLKRDASVLPDIQEGEQLFLYAADPPTDWEIRKPQIQAAEAAARKKAKGAATPDYHNPRPVQHFTQPPARYTEASLVRKLEQEGVGRPSTYASIISTIQDRGYVRKSGNQLVPTFVAMAVTRLLERNFPNLVDLQFTAQMEQSLDDISNGEGQQLPYLEKFYLGNDGLEEQVKQHEEQIDPREACTLRMDNLTASIRVGKYGPYLEWNENGETLTASLPDEIAPAEIDEQLARKLLELKQAGPKSLGQHPEQGLPVYVLSGPYGPYVQLGDVTDETPKPKRSSIPNFIDPTEIELEDAVKLLELPRRIGRHPEDDKVVNAGLGRFGPYVVHDKKYGNFDKKTHTFTTSDGRTVSVLDVDMEAALEMLAQSKSRGAATPLKELGPHPQDQEMVAVFEGKYGPYVKWGKVNATLPKDREPTAFTLEEAIPLLAERAARGKGKQGKKAAKKGAETKSTAARKTTKKKSTKKKTAKKKSNDA